MDLLTYIIAKWRKVLLPICKRSFVWMWPIKLSVRSTWPSKLGRHGAGRMSPVQPEQEQADRHMNSKKLDAAAFCGMLRLHMLAQDACGGGGGGVQAPHVECMGAASGGGRWRGGYLGRSRVVVIIHLVFISPLAPAMNVSVKCRCS